MKTKLTLEQEQKLELQCIPTARLFLENAPEYWSQRFKKPFPLAPTRIRKQMTPEKYKAGCDKFSQQVYLHYQNLGIGGRVQGDFWSLGAGNLDDTRLLIPSLRSLGWTVNVADFSEVVVGRVRKYFRDELQDPEAAANNVHRADIRCALTKLVNYKTTRVIHLSRILDHIEPQDREVIAGLLRRSVSPDNPVLVTIINHDSDDNPVWSKLWRTVWPFNTKEYINSFSEHYKKKVEVLAETGPWDVFGEVFRAYTFSLPA